MKLSSGGKALIKNYEGFRALPYLCPAGIPTIGYGATYYQKRPLIKVRLSDPAITRDKADMLFEQTIGDFEAVVLELVKVKLNQGQFDALVSFVFNLGGDRLKSSTLLRLLNRGQYSAAADQFLRWNKARENGRITVMVGLTNRRAAERALFLESKV